MFKVTVKTQQQCINISILLWQHVSILLDRLQDSIQRYEVQSVDIMCYGIPYYLQGVHKNSLNPQDIIQGIHKRMVRFQKLTRNLFLTLHGHNVHRQQRQLSKFLMR